MHQHELLLIAIMWFHSEFMQAVQSSRTNKWLITHLGIGEYWSIALWFPRIFSFIFCVWTFPSSFTFLLLIAILISLQSIHFINRKSELCFTIYLLTHVGIWESGWWEWWLKRTLFFSSLPNILIEKHLGMRLVFIICMAGWVSRLFTHGHMYVACYYRAIHSFRRGSVVTCVRKFQIRKEQQL